MRFASPVSFLDRPHFDHEEDGRADQEHRPDQEERPRVADPVASPWRLDPAARHEGATPLVDESQPRGLGDLPHREGGGACTEDTREPRYSTDPRPAWHAEEAKIFDAAEARAINSGAW